MWEVIARWPDQNTLALIGQQAKNLIEIDISELEQLTNPPEQESLAAKPNLLQTTKEGKRLLRAVLNEPDNLTPRREAAKWLAKNGDAQRAELIRKQCSKKAQHQRDAEGLLDEWFDPWTAPLAAFKLDPESLEFRNGFPFRLTLTGDDVTDASLKSLAAFPTLEYLDLSNSNITARGISKLDVLPNLRELNIYDTRVSHGALKHLKKHQRLQDIRHSWRDPKALQAVADLNQLRNRRFLKLDLKRQRSEALRFFERRFVYPDLKIMSTSAQLSQSGITDADLVYLSVFPKIRALELFECPLDGSGLRYLQTLPIRELSLRDTNVSQLKPLAKFSKLKELSLSDTYYDFDCSELQHLRKLGLTSLTFYGTGLTDQAIPYLLKIQTLKKLDLQGCDLSEEGVEKLKAGLPNLAAQHFQHDW